MGEVLQSTHTSDVDQLADASGLDVSDGDRLVRRGGLEVDFEPPHQLGRKVVVRGPGGVLVSRRVLMHHHPVVDVHVEGVLGRRLSLPAVMIE